MTINRSKPAVTFETDQIRDLNDLAHQKLMSIVFLSEPHYNKPKDIFHACLLAVFDNNLILQVVDYDHEGGGIAGIKEGEWKSMKLASKAILYHKGLKLLAV
jgi:hypothetical protein